MRNQSTCSLFLQTKYAAKPMEQVQNLTTQYALGMRRLEEKHREDENIANDDGGEHRVATIEDKKNLIHDLMEPFKDKLVLPRTIGIIKHHGEEENINLR